MVKQLKIKRRDFFQGDSIPILVSRTVKTRKFKLLYFRNETCVGAGNLHKDLFPINLQPSVNKARFKRRISHVQNLTRELNACQVRRLDQLNSTV